MRPLFLFVLILWSVSVFVHATESQTPDVHVFPAELDRVVDGDTVDVRLTMPLGLEWNLRLRILDIDTPETWRPETKAEEIHGKAATALAQELLGTKPFWVRVVDWGAYNRAEADIILHDLRDYVTVMKQSGFEKKDHYEE